MQLRPNHVSPSWLHLIYLGFTNTVQLHFRFHNALRAASTQQSITTSAMPHTLTA